MSRSLDTLFHALVDVVAQRYRAAGRRHRGFVRGKLRYDPMYRALLLGDSLPSSGRVVDVGCGRGILLALLDTARREEGTQPSLDGWVAPTVDLVLHGIELMPSAVAVARIALGPTATIDEGDAATHPLPTADAVLLLDVLHYLEREDQDRLIARASGALVPGGVLVIREAAAGPGWRFAATRAAERVRALFRGHWRQRFAYRSAVGWRELAERHGLTVWAQPMSDGTPFDNELIIAHRDSY